MAGLLPIILAGAAVVPAAPIMPNAWFNSRDQPKTAMRVAERGAILYTVDVAPDGSAIRCTVPEQDDLSLKVCDLVMKRARFQPATDDQGRPAFGLYEGMSSFLMPGKQRPRPDRSKLVVAVAQLPAGVTSPAYARVGFHVDAAGAISHCAALPGERRRFMQTVDALGPAACESLLRDYHPVAVRDASGAVRASVQSALVRFEQR